MPPATIAPSTAEAAVSKTTIAAAAAATTTTTTSQILFCRKGMQLHFFKKYFTVPGSK